MILNLITLATVKAQLGLTDGTYDSEITAMIPIVSSDVRRILNFDYDQYVSATFDETADTINFGIPVSYYATPLPDSIPPYTLGQVVYHPNIPQDTYLESYDPATNIYTLSDTPTDSGSYVYPSVQLSNFPTISKMIWYRITQLDTASASDETLKSYSIGPISKTYADSEINKQYNYPNVLIQDLGLPYASV